MKITIATPCYNSVSTIEKTILSVLKAKQINDVEYIIIDGASTDGTLNIIDKYRKDIDLIVSEKDAGIYDAFNKCVRAATGDYVLILAADDYLLEGAIESFKKSVENETEVWVGSVVIFYDGYFQYMFSEKDLSLLNYCCSLRHPATFFRKDSFEKYGYYNPKLKVSGDREIFLRMREKGAVFQVEDNPIVYFSMEGISNERLNDLAIPEERKISLEYGLKEEEIDKFYEIDMKKRIKNFCKMLTVKSHTYHLFCKLTGRGRKFLSKKEWMQLGVQEDCL